MKAKDLLMARWESMPVMSDQTFDRLCKIVDDALRDIRMEEYSSSYDRGLHKSPFAPVEYELWENPMGQVFRVHAHGPRPPTSWYKHRGGVVGLNNIMPIWYPKESTSCQT